MKLAQVRDGGNVVAVIQEATGFRAIPGTTVTSLLEEADVRGATLAEPGGGSRF